MEDDLSPLADTEGVSLAEDVSLTLSVGSITHQEGGQGEQLSSSASENEVNETAQPPSASRPLPHVSRRPKRKQSENPQKPYTGYGIFASYKRAAHIEAGNLPTEEALLRQQWKDLPDSEKEEYEEQARKEAQNKNKRSDSTQNVEGFQASMADGYDKRYNTAREYLPQDTYTSPESSAQPAPNRSPRTSPVDSHAGPPSDSSSYRHDPRSGPDYRNPAASPRHQPESASLPPHHSMPTTHPHPMMLPPHSQGDLRTMPPGLEIDIRLSPGATKRYRIEYKTYRMKKGDDDKYIQDLKNFLAWFQPSPAQGPPPPSVAPYPDTPSPPTPVGVLVPRSEAYPQPHVPLQPLSAPPTSPQSLPLRLDESGRNYQVVHHHPPQYQQYYHQHPHFAAPPANFAAPPPDPTQPPRHVHHSSQLPSSHSMSQHQQPPPQIQIVYHNSGSRSPAEYSPTQSQAYPTPYQM